MNGSLNARITRYLLIQWIRRNLVLVIGGPIVVIATIAIVLNQPVSTRVIDGRFIRFTVTQSNAGQQHPVVFCDLTDGRTIAATASPAWIPLHPGDVIRLEEQAMFWGGLRYRVP